jgi:hypothetical protein
MSQDHDLDILPAVPTTQQGRPAQADIAPPAYTNDQTMAGDHAKQGPGTSDEPAGHAHNRIVEPDKFSSRLRGRPAGQ